MASSYNYQNNPYSNSYYRSDHSPPFPLHLCFFLLTLLLFMGLSWYLTYESVIESLVDQLRLLLIFSPLLLLLVVHFLSSGDPRRSGVPFNILSLPQERESFYRAGGSPWGVGMVLVLLLFMVSYQNYFHERWFPLLSHR